MVKPVSGVCELIPTPFFIVVFIPGIIPIAVSDVNNDLFHTGRQIIAQVNKLLLFYLQQRFKFTGIIWSVKISSLSNRSAKRSGRNCRNISGRAGRNGIDNNMDVFPNLIRKLDAVIFSWERTDQFALRIGRNWVANYRALIFLWE